jgi:hypothetical protein
MVADIYEFEIKHHSLNMYGHCVRENCPNRPGGDSQHDAKPAEKQKRLSGTEINRPEEDSRRKEQSQSEASATEMKTSDASRTA